MNKGKLYSNIHTAWLKKKIFIYFLSLLTKIIALISDTKHYKIIFVTIKRIHIA